MNFSCVPGCRALKTNPSVLWARSVGLSVEFSRLLGAQAERHHKALRCCTSTQRGKRRTTCHSEILDRKKKKNQQENIKKNHQREWGERTRGVLMAVNVRRSNLTTQDKPACECVFVCVLLIKHGGCVLSSYTQPVQCLLSQTRNSSDWFTATRETHFAHMQQTQAADTGPTIWDVSVCFISS